MMMNLDDPKTFVVKEETGWTQEGPITETHTLEADIVGEVSHSTVTYYNSESGELLMVNTERLLSARTGGVR